MATTQQTHSATTRQALTNYRILDLSRIWAGPYCTKLLADFGAEVLKVERPLTGDPARRMAPFHRDEPDPEKSLLFSYLNTSKRGITLDLKSKAGRGIVLRLVEDADILVADSMNKKMMSALEDNLRSSGRALQAAMLGDAHTYHADVKDVAEIAQQAGVKHLVLSHIMPSSMEEQIPQFTEGLGDIYRGEISVGHDLARYGIE